MELQVPHILLMFRREFYESLWGQQLALGKLVLALVTFIPLCSAVQETKAEDGKRADPDLSSKPALLAV